MLPVLLLASSLQGQSPASFTSHNYPGATATYAYGINNKGQVVGSYHNPTDDLDHGFLYEAGIYTTIDPPNSDATYAYSINSLGQIAGTYDDTSTGYTKGFVYDGTSFSSYQYPSANTPFAAVNSSGQAVGFAVSLEESFSYNINTSQSTLSNWATIPGCPSYSSSSTDAQDINDSGLIVGNCPSGGFVYNGSSFTIVNDPGGASSITGISNSGLLVGEYFASDTDPGHGFFYNSGIFTDFEIPNASYTYPADVNDSGIVVGWYTDASGDHGFVTNAKFLDKCGAGKVSCGDPIDIGSGNVSETVVDYTTVGQNPLAVRV